MDNTQTQLEEILNTKVEVVKKRINKETKEILSFNKLIKTLEFIHNRTASFYSISGIDMNKYNTTFYDVIYLLLEKIYNELQVKLILFYLFERINPNNTINVIKDKINNRDIILQNPEDLYKELRLLNDNKKRKKEK